jgi:RNA polymerase sigma-70 factor (ECF subfamily)
MKKFSEQELLNGCLAQKPEMQRALYQQYGRTMMGICYRYMRDTMEAEDILQTGFLKVFEKLESFRGGSLEGWMKRLFVRECIDQIRRNKRSIFLYSEDPGNGMAIELDDVTSSMAADEIVQLIQSLPDGCRVVFNLFAVEGYSHREIAELLGISEGTSKSQYFRSKELLKERIFARENG